jgi:transcriptional regulator with XRE-family HTH domain
MEGMDLRQNIGLRIREIRRRLDYDQARFGQQIGVKVQSVSSYEVGDSFPTIETLIKIAKLGNVSLDWLILGKIMADSPTSKTETTDPAENELRLLRAYRSADAETKEVLLHLVEILTKNKRKRK